MAQHRGPNHAPRFRTFGMQVPTDQQDVWTPDQDGTLIAVYWRLRGSGDAEDWNAIGRELHREAIACERRMSFLNATRLPDVRAVRVGDELPDPATAAAEWTIDDDRLLRKAVEGSLDWVRIAQRLPGRPATGCAAHWHDLQWK